IIFLILDHIFPPLQGRQHQEKLLLLALEELMERVKAQQALLLDDMKLTMETSEPQQAGEKLAASSETSDGHLENNKRTLEKSQDITDTEKKTEESKGDENDLERKSTERKNENKEEEPREHVKAIKHVQSANAKKEQKKTGRKIEKVEDKSISKSDNEGMDQSDTQLTEIHSEYSYEHSVMESSNGSGSTSYEGVKITVSVSELSEKMYRHHGSKGKKVVSVKSPQKLLKHHGHRKTCKKRHKPLDEQQIESEKESHVDKDSKYISPSKVRKEEKNGKVKLISTKMDDSMLEGDKNWSEVLEKTSSSKKDSSESTKYMSPPEQLISSNIEHLASLLAFMKNNQTKKDDKECKINPLLVHYISRLLSMSRESVENLGVSSSDISTPEIESSSGESISLNVEQTTSLEDRTQDCRVKMKDVIDSVFRNIRQKTDVLPCKAPCSGVPQHVPGTSTPQENEEELMQSAQSGTRDNQRLEISTPPFNSRFKNMSLEEYKALKFPDIFPEYSQRCTRISNLAKRIEEIRKEQKRLLGNISGSSSSNSGSGQDSTRYISPPESITIMTRFEKKGNVTQLHPGEKENIPPCIPHKFGHCVNIPCSICHDDKVKSKDKDSENGGRLQSSQSFYSTPPESATALLDDNNRNGNTVSPTWNQRLGHHSVHLPKSSHKDGSRVSTDGNVVPQPSTVNISNRDVPCLVSGTYLQGVCGLCPQDNGRRCDPNKCLISKEPRPHARPPSTSVRRNFKSNTDNVAIQELSTIIEGDSTVTSIGSSKEKAQDVNPADTSDDSIPDVLSEMLNRGLITSPPSWLRNRQNSSSDCSCHSSRKKQNSNASDDYIQANFFTYIGQKSEELSQMLREGYKNLPNKLNLPKLIIDVFSKLGKSPSKNEIDEAFKKIGFRWIPSNENEIRQPTVYFKHIDVTTTHFQDNVCRFFERLTVDSPLEELENAFKKIGIVCSDASLRRNINGKSVCFSPSTIDNSSGSYGSAILSQTPTSISVSTSFPSTLSNSYASTSTGSAVLPPIPTSISVSTENLSSQDISSSENK
ncbi:hypothetical protein L9F63_017948, partial [Diploptera punctata]